MGPRESLLAHFARPKGKVVPEMSLSQIAPALEAALGVLVDFCAATIGADAAASIAAL